MRSLMLARMRTILGNPDVPARLFLLEPTSEARTADAIRADGRYPDGFDFDSLDDAELLTAFEQVIAASVRHPRR